MRLDRVVFAPAAPLLIPDVASGAAHELGAVRAAISAYLGALSAARVVVVGRADTTRAYPADSSVSLRGLGINRNSIDRDGDDDKPLPTALSVGAWLCRDNSVAPTGFVGIDSSSSDEELDAAMELVAVHDPTTLVIIGDGSARRSSAAPGAFDERAAELDASIEGGLAEVDTAGLLQLDRALCDELLVNGRAAWQLAARAIGSGDGWRGRAQMFDPYGVAYFVGSWARVDG